MHPPQTPDLLQDRRIVLLSNREPYVRKKSPGKTTRYEPRTGGLVTALEPVMRQTGGVWVAWDADGDADSRVQVPESGPQFTLSRVALTVSEVQRYYFGFANRALWPLCHYFVDRCHFDETQWSAYQRVNAKFAAAVAQEVEDGDLIWVHDYHFCLAPRLIREQRTSNGPISFFLHIPFPHEEIFRVVPWRRELLAGLLGADVIGFHTVSYVENFLGCCERILGAEIDRGGHRVRWEGRTIRVGAFPIGIDVDSFERVAAEPDVQARSGRIRRNIGTEKIVLGIDRLDYSKGIIERLHAIEALFARYPDHQGRVTFVQVAVPSRTRVKEYEELKRQIDETVGRINGKLSSSGWSPILYIYRGLDRANLAAYYCAADVALITPLRDGMNLVAKEYCASHLDGDGVLVLSEFAGAAERLGEGALLVNPYSIEDVAEALDWALTMSVEERKRRMTELRAGVRDSDIHAWLQRNLEAALPGSEPPPPIERSRPHAQP